MSRPSNHTDLRLIKTAREMYPKFGCARLSLRDVAKKSNVNLGMFHYYFKTKNEFIKRVFHNFYEEFLENFDPEPDADGSSFDKLRSTLLKIAFFTRDNNEFMSALFSDLMNGEPVATEFARKNFNRHFKLMHSLIEECQKKGFIEPIEPQQIASFMMPAIVFPIVLASRIKKNGKISKSFRAKIDAASEDSAIVKRVDMALKGISFSKRKSR